MLWCRETFLWVLDALQGSEWRTIPSGVCVEGKLMQVHGPVKLINRVAPINEQVHSGSVSVAGCNM
jgi:hypothetical protein